MRVRVQMLASYADASLLDGDGEWFSRPAYEVSSSLELFDRLMRMRHLPGLLSIDVRRAFPFSGKVNVASVSPVPQYALPSYVRRAAKIVPGTLAKPEAIEQLAYEVWEVILSHRDGKGINRE